ncbi:MAG: 23S rRNA (adenine(1618)-N(6))-methyltransferase RlmF [Acidobacteria bacterium]|nr:MAG: 23S rRNA (adenine(1618)-N(6))-methyltransferase RlmF [Acidobacteriota bacterium]
MHARNRFQGEYDFDRLISASPRLAEFVAPTRYGHPSVDFADSRAVAALNEALLADAYGVRWSLPQGALCPPIPGRADYIYYLADLIGGKRGSAVRIIDIGSGANGIYPIIGAAEFGWSFVATEIDKTSMRWARQVVRVNRKIAPLIEHRLQLDPLKIFAGVTSAAERFDASMCNPPFHASAKEAADASRRKRRNLELRNPEPLNFGGSVSELITPGGETGFIERMITESAARPRLCRWFTTLVSKSERLPQLRRALKTARAAEVRIIEMAQGQKKSRILAWTFQ